MNDVNVLSTPAGWNGTFIRTSLTHGRKASGVTARGHRHIAADLFRPPYFAGKANVT